MALRTTPPGEDPTKGTRGLPVPFAGPGAPPGEDGIARAPADQLENVAAYQTGRPDGVTSPDDPSSPSYDFLPLVKEAELQSQLYTAQVNRRAWSQSFRAFHQEHYIGSKYTRPEWRTRSRLFVPKTRTAVRKDLAAVAASLFNSIDAVNCLPGNEADPRQRGAAAVMEELVNYRTDRTSGKASFPWFLIACGARQDTVITGICISKQYWKHEYRHLGEHIVEVDDPESGNKVKSIQDHYGLEVDRPDVVLFAPENVVLDPAADWTNPAQSSAYLILKYPMTVEDVQAKQQAPVNPWNPSLTEAQIRGAANIGKQDMEAVRRAREGGLDRYDETQTGTEFQIVWVYEVFMRLGGEDWQFWSLGDQFYLTDPKPTREAYPEQFGERPVVIGYGALEAHRIYPMAPVESWQPLQVETNDLRNLQLDAVKQNVMPITKVKRGRQIDMDQVRRRSAGASIFVNEADDVTWENPPQVPESAVMMGRELDLELDDLAGQQNYANVENNNALGKTLGGLKLAAGAANAVQEYDIRVWIETWAQPVLSQVVRLEQFYENDPTILGICGQRAQLFEKYGINKIDDQLLEQEVTIRVSAGLGAGDPQQRLAKFQTAAQVIGPMMQMAPEIQSGQVTLNFEAVCEEVFGAVGYKDGGARFFTKNPGPKPNPMQDLKTQELVAKIQKDKQTGQGAFFTGMANLAKVALGKRELEANVVDMMLGHQGDAQERGFAHGHQTNQTHLAALEHGHRHGMAINEHRRSLSNDQQQHELSQQQAQQNGEGAGGPSPPVPGPEGAQPGSAASAAPDANASAPLEASQPASSPPDLMALLHSGQLEFTRHPHTGRINGLRMAGQHGGKRAT